MKAPINKIEYLRRINFYSQLDIANLIGMSQAGYRKIEIGETRLTIDVAQQLVTIFKVERIEDLLEVSSEREAS